MHALKQLSRTRYSHKRSSCFFIVPEQGKVVVFPLEGPGLDFSTATEKCTNQRVDAEEAKLQFCFGMPAPVVLIHGVFGWGYDSPFGNRVSSYWPDSSFSQWDGEVAVVDIGPVSSLHDRACEAFYQLRGGTVDYGEDHARQSNHERFSPRLSRGAPLLQKWDEEHPIHIVGHSYGGPTAIMLYQMLCEDFFKVGSSASWVISITTLGSPLSGCTLPYAMGITNPDLTIPKFSISHLVGVVCGSIWKLQQEFPTISWVYNFRAPQWAASWRSILTIDHPYVHSWDNSFHAMIPALVLKRNSMLRDMDRVFLFSGMLGAVPGTGPSVSNSPTATTTNMTSNMTSNVTSSVTLAPSSSSSIRQSPLSLLPSGTRVVMAAAALLLVLYRRSGIPLGLSRAVGKCLLLLKRLKRLGIVGFALLLLRFALRFHRSVVKFGLGTTLSGPLIHLNGIFLKRHPSLKLTLFPDYRQKDWIQNDGVVNVVSQMFPARSGLELRRELDAIQHEDRANSSPTSTVAAAAVVAEGGEGGGDGGGARDGDSTSPPNHRRLTVDLGPLLHQWENPKKKEGEMKKETALRNSSMVKEVGEGGGGGLKRGTWHCWRVGGASAGVDHRSFTSMDPKAVEHYKKLYLALARAESGAGTALEKEVVVDGVEGGEYDSKWDEQKKRSPQLYTPPASSHRNRKASLGGP